MEPVHYLRALRQWWFILVALTLFGIFAAFLTFQAAAPSFIATHTLVQEDDEQSLNLARAAFLTTNGEVPERVAAKLGEDPEGITAGIFANLNVELDGVDIQADAPDPERSIELADSFATELTASLDEKSDEEYRQRLDAATEDFDAAAAALAGATPLTRDVLTERHDAAFDALEAVQDEGPSGGGLVTIGETTVDGAASGTSRMVRVAVGGFLGLLLGVIVALMLTRFDTRIRSREAAEVAFSAPVLAEIPMLRRRLRRGNTVITKTDPESLGAEAYRSVRTALVVAGHARRTREEAPRRRRRGATMTPAPAKPSRGRVVMVVSPGMSEGKTTTTANLAAAFAETGSKVLVMGLDLRRPELHNYFGVQQSPGITDVLATRDRVDGIVQEVDGVLVAPSGRPVDHPGELLARGYDIIEAARSMADVVIFDTAPLLATDDASVLLPLVDDVVLVCRAGRTPTEAAERARDLLQRLEAPIAGVVVIGSQQLASARSYYRSDYRSRTRAVPELPSAGIDAVSDLPVTDAVNGEVPSEATNGAPISRVVNGAPISAAPVPGGDTRPDALEGQAGGL